MCFNGGMTTTRAHNAHDAHNLGLYTEAREMALLLVNGQRGEVRQFLANHDTPTKLALAIIRCLVSEGHEGGDALLAVVNLQSLIESVEV